jgi:hypothetical protein
LMAPATDISAVGERTIEGPGGKLRLRLYTPHGTVPFPFAYLLPWQRLRAVQPQYA